MSHFYGTLQGNRGEATRGGSQKSGMETYCASWSGAIRCMAYVDDKGRDCVRVTKTTWQGQGESKLLYDGLIGEVPTEEQHQEEQAEKKARAECKAEATAE